MLLALFLFRRGTLWCTRAPSSKVEPRGSLMGAPWERGGDGVRCIVRKNAQYCPCTGSRCYTKSFSRKILSSGRPPPKSCVRCVLAFAAPLSLSFTPHHRYYPQNQSYRLLAGHDEGGLPRGCRQFFQVQISHLKTIFNSLTKLAPTDPHL